MTFKELNLSAPLLRAVQEAGYETPSPIQAAAIPPVLSGRDLMAAPRPVPARRLLLRCPCWTGSRPMRPAERVQSAP